MYSSKKNEQQIINKLQQWYKYNKRDLPWRVKNKQKSHFQYYVFISEFMLQQTTVNTVIPKFNKFIELWPNIASLSKTNETNILKFWSGLGYYRRAKNLLKTSKYICKYYNCIIPRDYKTLISFPGIGEYTAKAILGIAFNKPYLPIDTNIERILSRIYCLKSPKNKIKKIIKERSNLFISKKSSSSLIQAFMDYGSVICKPKNPICKICILQSNCDSFKNNLQNIIPLKLNSKLSKRKKYTRAYILFNENKEILVRKRSSSGMLPSMLEIPNDKWVLDKNKLKYDEIIIGIRNKMQNRGSIEYSFSHFNLEAEVFFIKVKKNFFTKHKWIQKNNLKNSGLPTVMKKIVESAF